MKLNIRLASTFVVPILVSLGGCTDESGSVPPAVTPDSTPKANERVDAAISAPPPPVARTSPAPDPQTPPAPVRSDPAENGPLQQAAKQLASALFEAIAAGVPSRVAALTITDDERAEILADGYRQILGPRLKRQNQEVLGQLSKSVEGRKVTDYGYRPGKLTETAARGSFVAAVPHMRDAVVTLRVDGVYIEIQLDQLVYLNGNWKIFEMTLP